MPNDYSRPKRAPSPRELAAMITRNANLLARRFEGQAINQRFGMKQGVSS